MLLLSGTDAVLVQYAASTFNKCSAEVDPMLCGQHMPLSSDSSVRAF